MNQMPTQTTTQQINPHANPQTPQYTQQSQLRGNQPNITNPTPTKLAPATLPNIPSNKPIPQQNQTPRSMVPETTKIKTIEKEKFYFNFNFDTLEINEGDKKKECLTEVYKKLKNPYGDDKVIEKMKRDIEEMVHSQQTKENMYADGEDQVQKRVKPNPMAHKETNLLTNIQPKEIPSTSSAYNNELQDIKKDYRFKVEEKINNPGNPFLDVIIYKNNASLHDKIVLRLNKIGQFKISIQEMANLSDFAVEYQEALNDALIHGKLKKILELWLEFLDKLSERALLKLNDFDELFG
jgi:hypothetical protein